MLSLERYSCTSFDVVCMRIVKKKFGSTPVWEMVELFVCGGFFFFFCICSVWKEHGLCSTPTWCSFLPCLISVAQRPLSETILRKVPSPRSVIALQFGTLIQLSVPMLCSLLFSKVQNNVARFHQQLPVHPDALGCNFHTSWRTCLNMLPYPSSARASKYGGIYLAQTVQQLILLRSMLNALPDEMFRVLAISSNKMWTFSSIMTFTSAANSLLHFLLFFTLSLLLSLISQIEKVSSTGNLLLLKEWMMGLQITAQREFLVQTVQEWCISWCRADIQQWRESGFLSFF